TIAWPTRPPAAAGRLRGSRREGARDPAVKIEAYAPPPEAAKPLSATQMLATLRAALQPWKPGTPFWVFAYGSLMWNPSFTWDAQHVALVRGYHRSFRLWSRMNRGTPERPGLVLTLERG